MIKRVQESMQTMDRPGPMWLLVPLLFLGGCTYSFTYVEDRHIDDCTPDEVIDAAWEAYQIEDFDEAAHLGAYIPEYYPEHSTAEEALFLAGDSCFRLEEYWNSFNHFKELLNRYPVSQYVGDIAERDFLIGEAFLYEEPGFFGHLFTNRSRGVRVLNHLLTNFSHHNLADDAQIAIADYYYEEEEYEDAALNYKQLLKLYGTSEWAEKSNFRLGMSYLKGSKGVSYDREDLLRAWITFESYLTYYERGGYKDETVARSRQVREMLAEKEWEIAGYYLNQDCTFGARIHMTNIVLLFPDTATGRKALTFLQDRDWDRSLHSVDRVVPRESMRFLPGSDEQKGTY